MRLTERFVSIFTAVRLTDQIDQHQVVFGSARDNIDTAFNKGFCHRLGVFGDLRLIGFVFGRHRLFEANRFSGDDVHQRTTLTAGEYCRVKFFLNFFVSFGQNQTTTWTAQGFVSGSGGYVSNLHRVRIQTGSNQTGDVRHIDKQVSTDFVSDIAEALPIYDLRVSRETGNNDFRLMFQRQTFNFVIVDQTGFGVQTVLDGVVVFARGAHFSTVGQVT